MTTTLRERLLTRVDEIAREHRTLKAYRKPAKGRSPTPRRRRYPMVTWVTAKV
jgi:hypothetical protein